jgi:signal transduction histidine kinase
LFFADSHRHHTFGDLNLAAELARRAAAAVENARLFLEAQQAVSKRDDFLSVASHELKTPLTSLELVIDSLLRTAELGRLDKLSTDALVAKLKKVDRQAARLNRLINELLDVSRITAGRLALDCQRFDLVPLVHEVAARFAEHVHRAGAPLSIGGEASVLGEWDRNRIDQVLTNLFSNAIKYGEGKPVRVEVSSDEHWVRVRVEDQGLGVEPDEQARIFERFERGSTARNVGGIGLGLWISREILLAHGGRIGLTSRPREGSTFVVELPRMTPASSPSDPPSR